MHGCVRRWVDLRRRVRRYLTPVALWGTKLGIDYQPDGMSIWDPWFVVNGDRVHMFYQQMPAPGSPRDVKEGECIGHAVSEDLAHWRECPPALYPGPKGSLDDLWPATGCACEADGKFYLFYTMRCSANNGDIEHIGVATSSDCENWERYPHNPVISPDPRFYRSHGGPGVQGRVDCRDLVVVRDPNGGWLGFYVARVPGDEAAEAAVIGCARSRDLLNWEPLPPAFAPRKYGTIEVPDVFRLDGRWYMTCFTGTHHGNRGGHSDPYVMRGTIYAVAERPEGPYQEFSEDNDLIGGGTPSYVSCRSVVFEGKRYVFNTEFTEDGYVLCSPMRIVALPDARLRLAYSDRTAVWREKTLIEPRSPLPIARLPMPGGLCVALLSGRWSLIDGEYRGESRSGWQAADLGVGARNVEIEAVINLHEGVAGGLVYHPNSSSVSSDGDIAVVLDAEEQSVSVVQLLDFSACHKRHFLVERDTDYHIRVCVHYPRFEVYINDIAAATGAVKPGDTVKPSVGFIVDRGKVTVRDVAVYEL